MKRNLLLFLLLMHSLFNSVLRAQKKGEPVLEVGHGSITKITQSARRFGFTDEKGTWEFEVYPGNIIKTIFKPNNYATDELISNAVILKPVLQKISIERPSEVNQVMRLGDKVALGRKNGVIWYYVDGKLISILQEGISKDGLNGFALRLQHDEKIFGGGERALPMNRRGYRFNLYNNPWYGYENGADNLNFSVPFFISSNGYGIFFDNASKGYADIGKTNPGIFEAGFISNELNFYLIPGKNVDDIMRSYTNLTGRQAIPPRWVFGNFMSRFGYTSEKQVKDIYEKMKEDRFPVDAIIFDLFWFGDSIKGTMGNLDWVNKEKWPDPKRMITDFAKEGVKTILITEPFVLKSTPNYEPSKQFHSTDSAGNPFVLEDFYFGEGGLIDIFRKDAQDWFWSKYNAQIANGVAGWWGDLGEPEKHPAGSYHDLKDLGFTRKFSADEVHNLYGHFWSKMLYEKYAKHYPNTRLFHLNRSGFAGSQRYNVFPWTGDVHRNWNGLKAQLPILLGMSMSGIPYAHSDAGGFAMGEKDPELYTRWLQFAAFTPIFRPHGTALGDVDPSVANIESEPVFYPEPYKSIINDLIWERCYFLPYNYTLAYEQQQFGRPLMRPMFYHYSSDPESYNANDQYMWGENLLVAPVFEKGAIEKKVYLPAGRWYNMNNETILEGRKWVTVEAGIEEIPLFAREGAFIPTNPVGFMSGGDNPRPANMSTHLTPTDFLEILYVPSSKPSTYTLYYDDGFTTNAIEKKKFELIQFSGLSTNDKISISVKFSSATQVRYGSALSFEIPIPQKPVSVTVDGKRLTIQDDHYAPDDCFFYKERRKLRLTAYLKKGPTKIEIRIK